MSIFLMLVVLKFTDHEKLYLPTEFIQDNL